MNIYCISGLGADHTAFSQLTVNANLIPVNWIEITKNDTIESYALRLSEIIDQSQPFGLMGLSFGGLIAVELSKIVNTRFTILVSTVEVRSELPRLYRLIGKTRFLSFLPFFCFSPPKRLVRFLFGTNNTELLYPILKNSDLKFNKWALIQLLTWKNTQRVKSCTKINGTSDRLLKPSAVEHTVLIEGGHHFMIVDRCDEVSDIINKIVLASNN